MKAYGRSNLFEVITADAGFTSEANARLVNGAIWFAVGWTVTSG